MARIRGRDTAAELSLRQALWSQGIRYRKHQRVLGTRPDLLFPRAKLAVFVDGCFWHGCPKHYVRPRSASHAFWTNKLQENTDRDSRQTQSLEAQGWKVARFWEHEIERDVAVVAKYVVQLLRATQPTVAHWAVVAAEATTEEGMDLLTLREIRSGVRKQYTRRRVPSTKSSARSSGQTTAEQ